MKTIQIQKQFNTVYGLAIDIDVTIGSNFFNRSTYNIQGLYNTRTKKAKNLFIVEIDNHRYTKSEKQELSKWCKKNGFSPCR